MNDIKKTDIITCGFALFAIFFGAGNLIFPPYLGILSGDRWFEAMIGFFMTDPVLPIMGTLIAMKLGGRADDLGKRVGQNFAKLLGAIVILMIGPLFAVPRIGATTHELFTQQVFSGNVPYAVTSAIFFGITLWLAINPSKVMDYVGNILTPVLVIILSAIVIKSIVAPPGQMVTTAATELFSYGFKEGYQTMDVLVAALMAGLVNADLMRRGYTNEKTKRKAAMGVSFVAFLCLALVYGGLTFAGATVGDYYTPDIPRTQLLVGMTTLLWGDMGKIAIGIAASLACLTTSIGLVSICGNYFETITNGKMKYKKVVTVSTAVSFFISLLGVENLIAIAIPILTAIYPVNIVLILLAVFDKKIKYNWTYTGAVIGAFSVSLIEGLGLFGEMVGIKTLANLSGAVQVLPLSQMSFGWVIPSIIGATIFTIISRFSNKGEVGINYKS